MNKKFIEENLLTVKKKLNNRALMNLNIKESHEELYLIYYQIEKPICESCGKEKRFLGFTRGYYQGCTKSCTSTRDRRKKTCIERYGVDTVINKPNIREKCLKKAASKESREKAKQTVQYRYGVDNISQINEVKLKKEQTFLKNYGVRHINQSSYHNTFKNSLRYKDYTMPSGIIRKYQGYENRLLDELLLQYSEDEILTNRKDMPKFIYFFEGKERRYFPDAYIPKTNTIYEVKSKYTMKINEYRNELKFQSVIDSGYNFELIIY